MCNLLLWHYWKISVGVFKCLKSPSATNIPEFGTKEQHIAVHAQYLKMTATREEDQATTEIPDSCSLPL